LMILGLSQ